jgi:hypothetical protein
MKQPVSERRFSKSRQGDIRLVDDEETRAIKCSRRALLILGNLEIYFDILLPKFVLETRAIENTVI